MYIYIYMYKRNNTSVNSLYFFSNSLLIEFVTGKCIFKINSRTQVVLKSIFCKLSSLTVLVFSDKISENIRSKVMKLLHIVQLNLK